MEGVVRGFSVSLLGLELSSIFINNLDSGIENVLLTFGGNMKFGETVSLAEGGVRMENDPVKLEVGVITQVKQRKDPPHRQEYQLDKFRMATAGWVAVPPERIWGL